MSERVLVCYGTRYGSAGEIAEYIGKVLQDLEFEVDVINLKKEKTADLSLYSTVIVGSGIAAGRWTKEAKNFLEDNSSTLAGKRVALFVSCLSATDKEQCETARMTYLEDIAREFPDSQMIATGLFGGRIDPEKGNFFTKRIMKSLIKRMVPKDEEPPEKVDYRDWDIIKEWTRNLMGV